MADAGKTTSLKSIQGGATAPAPTNNARDPVVAAVTGALSKFKSVLPAHITPEKMARLSLGELRLNPKLREAAQANPQSLVSAIMLASQAGLEIGGAKGHGYLVPFNRKEKVGGEWQTIAEVKFIPGYRGLMALARNSGDVSSIGAHIVYANDTFDMTLGVEETIVHKPKLDGDRGAPLLVYGVARFKDGSHHFDWMSMHDVDKIMKSTQSKGEWGPWKDHKPEMIRKTMIRRLTKYLPMSSDRLEAAVAASDTFDSGQTIDGDGLIVDAGDQGDGQERIAETRGDQPTKGYTGKSVGEAIDADTGEITQQATTTTTKKADEEHPAPTLEDANG